MFLNLALVPCVKGESPLADNVRADESLMFVINGESNSGGYALNAQASPGELERRTSVRILNNTTLASFDDLQIGVNNLVGHDRLANGITHGFELELANRADADERYRAPCYLVKTGQGGSRIAEWNIKGTYYTAFLKRAEAASKLLAGQPHRTIVLFSLGINDAIAGTDVDVWQAAVKEHFGNVRRELGADTPIIMTRFMRRYALFNTAIEEICREVPNTYSVGTLDAPLRDDNHWDYVGMKRVTGCMLDVVESLLHE